MRCRPGVGIAPKRLCRSWPGKPCLNSGTTRPGERGSHGRSGSDISESDRTCSSSPWLGWGDSSGLRSGLPKAFVGRVGVKSTTEGGFKGDDGSGVWWIFLRFAPRIVCDGEGEPLASSDSFRGLDPSCDRFRAWAVRSRSARRAALGWEDTLGRGVKNRRNFLGVMDGCRRSLPRTEAILGGEWARWLSRRPAPVLASWSAILPHRHRLTSSRSANYKGEERSMLGEVDSGNPREAESRVAGSGRLGQDRSVGL